MHLRDQSKAPKNAKLHSHISVTLSLLEPPEIYQNEWSEPIFQNEHQIYDPEDLRRPSSLPMFLHHFCLAEKLRTLGESLPEMPPTFILALSSVCTIHHHVLHWGMKRFLLLIPAILSFHSPGFCHVFVLISHSLVEDHAVSSLQEACGVWNVSVAVDLILGSAPAVFLDPGICAKTCGFGCVFWGFTLRKFELSGWRKQGLSGIDGMAVVLIGFWIGRQGGGKWLHKILPQNYSFLNFACKLLEREREREIFFWFFSVKISDTR